MPDSIALARRALALLDLTDLSEASDEAAILALCEKAAGGPVPVAAICIWPRFVGLAKGALAGTGVRVATVANFPSGGDGLASVLEEVRAALADGADEIDLVLPWRTLLAGDAQAPAAMVGEVKALCGDRLLKVILESGAYPDAAMIRRAADLAIDSGADFLKTSTGKTGRSADPGAVRTMLEAIRAAQRPVGIKPSGGIRSLGDARLYLDLADAAMGPHWATPASFRLGASGLHEALLAVLGSETRTTAAEA